MFRIAIAVVAPLLLASTALASAPWATATLDYYFKLDWQSASGPKGPVVSGYLYNKSAMIADRVQLRIDALDANGQVVSSTGTWVAGGVPPENRTYFEACVPQAASYRVEISRFDFIRTGQ
jgi:hypothetical protein